MAAWHGMAWHFVRACTFLSWGQDWFCGQRDSSARPSTPALPLSFCPLYLHCPPSGVRARMAPCWQHSLTLHLGWSLYPPHPSAASLPCHTTFPSSLHHPCLLLAGGERGEEICLQVACISRYLGRVSHFACMPLLTCPTLRHVPFFSCLP